MNPPLRPLACCTVLLASLAVAGQDVRSLADLKQLEAQVTEVSQITLPATVALLSETTGSSGSGVIVGKDGLILTAAHVVQGAEEMLVVFPDGKQVPAKVLGANYSKDIAMARISEPGDWPTVSLGSSAPLKAGDWVIALGHSAGFDATRTPPVRFGRVISDGPGNFVTTDCTLIGGDSGGPLFDLTGKLIGIHSSIGQSLSNNNHAGIDGFREDWDRMLAGEAWGKLSMNPFANPEMPVLGIEMGVIRGQAGIAVVDVVAGSPAAAAGLKRGDVIQKFDGSAIEDGAALLQLLAKREPGNLIRLGVLRDDKEMDFQVTLKRRSDLFEN
jgi:serine protease Do